eukprot:1141288-Pelagomonas_calceolata.AAC.10
MRTNGTHVMQAQKVQPLPLSGLMSWAWLTQHHECKVSFSRHHEGISGTGHTAHDLPGSTARDVPADLCHDAAKNPHALSQCNPFFAGMVMLASVMV